VSDEEQGSEGRASSWQVSVALGSLLVIANWAFGLEVTAGGPRAMVA